MKTHGQKITRKMDEVIIALLAYPTWAEVARKTGASETTLWRWMQREDFKQAYLEAKNRVVDHSLARIQHASVQAVTTLQEVMKDSTNPASSRVTAAKTILELTVKVAEIDALETRLEVLERKLSK